MQTKFFIIITAFLLLARTTHTCLVYNGLGNSSYLQATVVNGSQDVCRFKDPVGSDGLFRFTCIAANYAAIAGQDQWSACEYCCGNNECFSTAIHAGDNIIDYGSLNPGDVVANLSSICVSGTCDSTPYTLTSDYTTGGEVETLTVTVTVNGVFDAKNPTVLNGLIAAIQATASNSWTNETVHWATGAIDNHFDTRQEGDVNLYKHTSFFGAAISDEVSGEQTPWSLTVSIVSAVASDDSSAGAFITGAFLPLWAWYSLRLALSWEF